MPISPGSSTNRLLSYDDAVLVLGSGALNQLKVLKKYQKNTQVEETALGALANIFFIECLPAEPKS